MLLLLSQSQCGVLGLDCHMLIIQIILDYLTKRSLGKCDFVNYFTVYN